MRNFSSFYASSIIFITGNAQLAVVPIQFPKSITHKIDINIMPWFETKVTKSSTWGQSGSIDIGVS